MACWRLFAVRDPVPVLAGVLATPLAEEEGVS